MSELDQSFKALTLKGSAQVVKEYLFYAIHNILYQRGCGPLDLYEQTKAYGLNLFVSKEPMIEQTINTCVADLEKLLKIKGLEIFRVVLYNKKTNETYESWQFNIEYENGLSTDDVDIGTKDHKKIRNEISSVLRQVMGTASVLPFVDDVNDINFKFEISLLPNFPLPDGWSKIDQASNIDNSAEIHFKPFSTSIHKVYGKVQYKDI